MYEGIKSRVQSDPRFDVMGTKSIRGVAYLVSKGDRKVRPLPSFLSKLFILFEILKSIKISDWFLIYFCNNLLIT